MPRQQRLPIAGIQKEKLIRIFALEHSVSKRYSSNAFVDEKILLQPTLSDRLSSTKTRRLLV